MTARAAAAGIGSETCGVTCTKPRAWQSSSIAALVATALIGTPPPSVLDSTSRSGTHVVDLEAIHRPEPTEPGLALVEHEQHPALARELRQAQEVARRQDDQPTGRQPRRGHHGRRRADRGLVEEVEARLQARAVTGTVAMADRAAVGVRRGPRERSGRG